MNRKEEIELYPSPKYPGDISYEGGFASKVRLENTGARSRTSIDECVRNIDEIIDEYLEDLELKEKHPGIDSRSTRHLNPIDRVGLQEKMREDERVFENAMEIIKIERPELFAAYKPKAIYSLISILDWNDSDKATMSEVFYRRPSEGKRAKLVVRGLQKVHSYVVQLTRSGHPMGTIDSPSVSGIINLVDHETDSTIFPIGYRGGRHLPNTAMTIPAGSVKIPDEIDEDTDPIFDSFFDELESELGRRKVYNVKILGHHYDPYVGGNTLFVVLANSLLDKAETMERFERAEDRKEHDHLIWRIFEPMSIFMDLVRHDLPYDRNNLLKVPDDKIPYLYPLKQSLVTLIAYLTSNRNYRFVEPSSVYEIIHKM